MPSSESRILNKLGRIERDITIMRKELDTISEYFADSRLTAQERRMVERSLKKIKKGDRSGFISHEKLKKELGL